MADTIPGVRQPWDHFAVCMYTMTLDQHFVIYDDDDQLKVIQEAMEGLHISPKQFSPRNVQGAISAAKSELIVRT